MMYPFYYKRPYRKYYPINISQNVDDFTPPIVKPINRYSQSQNFRTRNTIKNEIPKEEPLTRDINKNEKKNSDYFEILGFKLHYDDLIIIGLIWLLFSEGANDQFLIIALVLLIGD